MVFDYIFDYIPIFDFFFHGVFINLINHQFNRQLNLIRDPFRANYSLQSTAEEEENKEAARRREEGADEETKERRRRRRSNERTKHDKESTTERRLAFSIQHTVAAHHKSLQYHVVERE